MARSTSEEIQLPKQNLVDGWLEPLCLVTSFDTTFLFGNYFFIIWYKGAVESRIEFHQLGTMAIILQTFVFLMINGRQRESNLVLGPIFSFENL